MKFAAYCVALFLCVPATQAGIVVTPWMPIFKGIDRAAGTNSPDATIPRNQAAYVLRVDLTDPDVQLFTDPHCTNGCAGETLGYTTSGFLQRYGVQAAVNCSFFDPCCSQPPGSPMFVRGLSISRGVVVSPNQPGYTAEFLFTTNNVPTFLPNDNPPTNTAGIFTAVAGDLPLVVNGVVVASTDPAVNPRTAFGLSQDRRYLYLMTIDGRQGYSDGATDRETANWLILFGAYNALNTDGGGSATLVMADCMGKPVQLNLPIDGGRPGQERVIANHLGIHAKPLEGLITDVKVIPGSTTATVTWTTVSNATSQVAYGLTPSYGSFTALDATPVTNHSVSLSGLIPATNYFLRVISRVDVAEYTADWCFATTNNAPNGSLFNVTTNWKYSTDNLDRLGWQAAAYDDSGWPSGPGLLWADSRNPPNPAIQPKGTQLPINPNTTYPYITYYFRMHFAFTNSPAGAILTFSNYLDDGAAFYLNGVEIRRLLLPAPPTVITNGTVATGFGCAGDATCPQIFTVSGDSINNLVQGDNVLAVEVHNQRSNSPDVTFGAALLYSLPPPPEPQPPFLDNLSVVPGTTQATVTWTTVSNATSRVEYGLTASLGSSTPLDSTLVTNHSMVLTGLLESTEYHFRANSTLAATQYTADGIFSTVPFYESIIPLTGTWRYTAVDLDAQNWTDPGYDDSAWMGPGAALLYVEDNPDVLPKNTQLPGTPGSLPPTYYFRTHFNFTNRIPGFALVLSNYVDDGAVFYLNGTEISRLRMAPPPELISNRSLATSTPPFSDAVFADVLRVGGDLMTNLVQGDNVLAAEVHQDVLKSPDIVFGSALGYVRALASETRLWISPANSAVCLSWDGGNLTLQQTSDLGNTNSWKDVPGPVKTSPFCPPDPPATMFYRLRN